MPSLPLTCPSPQASKHLLEILQSLGLDPDPDLSVDQRRHSSALDGAAGEGAGMQRLGKAQGQQAQAAAEAHPTNASGSGGSGGGGGRVGSQPADRELLPLQLVGFSKGGVVLNQVTGHSTCSCITYNNITR